MTLSKAASEVLAQDIRGIEVDLANLDMQAQQLEARREALRYKLDIIKKAIGMAPDESPPPAIVPDQINGDGTLKSDDSHVKGTGFRASIRSVIKEASKGLRPRDVYDELKKRGVPYEGKSDPITRTSVEMWRMQKAGQLRKRGQLYYPQEAAQGG